MAEPNQLAWDLSLPSLAKAFEKYFMFGNIYSKTDNIDIANTRQAYLHHFNAVTAENWHKPYNAAPAGFIRPTASQYDFTDTDTIVDWAIKGNLALVGHVLVWHGQSPDWLYSSAPNTPLTRAKARSNMEFHIRTLAEHFTKKGTIGAFHSWDVVNEAFVSEGGEWGGNINDWNAGDWRTQTRENSPWYMAYANVCNTAAGEHPSDYIYDAYVFARRYFPGSILYYNDFNEEIPAKRNAIAQMVEQLNLRWARDIGHNPEAVAEDIEYNGCKLIEGIGMQSHFHLDQWPANFDNVRLALERFIAAGTVISITELDITIGKQDTPLHAPLNEADQLRQAQAFATLFGYYVKFADYIERVTVWGMTDKQSWRAWGQPTLFDRDFCAKKAFFAILKLANV